VLSSQPEQRGEERGTRHHDERVIPSSIVPVLCLCRPVRLESSDQVTDWLRLLLQAAVREHGIFKIMEAGALIRAEGGRGAQRGKRALPATGGRGEEGGERGPI
jgi:hypothetical protein